MLRIGIFGGTFDPPHIGHLVLADEARSQLNLDKVLWVLTSIPPHKKNQAVTPVELRLVMLNAALSENENFVISRVDIDRPEPHYAVDTVRLLKKQFPQDELIYLMGSDSLQDLPKWYQPSALVELVDEIGVMSRQGLNGKVLDHQVDAIKSLPGLSEKIRFIETPQLQIASSEIRKKVRNGGAYRYYLPPRVWRLILEHNLYSKDH